MPVDLIGPYRKSIKQPNPGGSIIRENFSLTCMKIIDPVTGWFKIVEIPTFDLDGVSAGNNEYIDE